MKQKNTAEGLAVFVFFCLERRCERYFIFV